MGEIEPVEVDEDGTPGLCFAAWIIVDTEDLLTLCTAQMEEIDSSKTVGSLTSVGTRLFNTSTMRFRLEVGVERTDVGSGSGSGDP